MVYIQLNNAQLEFLASLLNADGIPLSFKFERLHMNSDGISYMGSESYTKPFTIKLIKEIIKRDAYMKDDRPWIMKLRKLWIANL